MLATTSSPAICEAHGLRYDPAAYDGCVLCRREAHAPAVVATLAPARGWVRHALIGSALGVVALGLVAGAITWLGAEDEAPPAAAAPASPLRAYLGQARALLNNPPLDEAHEALDHLGDEARAGTLDTRARRQQIRALIATVSAQRDQLRALQPPETARAHHRAALNHYEILVAQLELAIRMTQNHDRRRAVVAGRAVRTRDDALRHQGRVDDALATVRADLERNRDLERRAREYVRQVQAEDRRLAGEAGM